MSPSGFPFAVVPWVAVALPAYNTLVVAAGVAAVGVAAGVVGGLGLLRKRPLVADAAAHATLLGVAIGFLVSGSRELPPLLAGGFVAAVAALAVVVAIRRLTRTRDDAATAIVIGVGFGAGITLVSGLTARGVAGSAGLEQFLLGHTAALTGRDAAVLAGVSAAVVATAVLLLKEFSLVAFDADFAAATGWPVGLLDLVLVALVAVMVVAGLPTAGAVLVTALLVIPAAAARQWTDRVATLLWVSGCFGLMAAVTGVAVTAGLPGIATGPVVVLVAAGLFAVSVVAASIRGRAGRFRAGHGLRLPASPAGRPGRLSRGGPESPG
jgi:manganese/zinc/iron transport system permease protein